MTKNLETPQDKEGFNQNKEWARRIVVEYLKKADPDWCLALCLKVLDVTVKENPHPGKTKVLFKAFYN